MFNDLPEPWMTQRGSGIEVQGTGQVSGVSAHSGSLYVELDSHQNGRNGGSTNNRMFQTVDFTPGLYTLSSYYQPRTGLADDNGIRVRVGANTLEANETTATRSG